MRKQVTLIAGLILAGGTLCQAADNSWTNTTGGNWETGVNWSLGVAPASSQGAVLLTNVPGKTIRIDGSTANSTRTISNLTIGVSNAVNSLVLSNAGTSASSTFRILSAFTNNAGGSVSISNSALRVDGIKTNDFYNDGTITLLNLGQLYLTNIFTSIGNATNASFLIRGGTARVGDLGVGELDVGTLTVSGGTLTLIGENFSGLYVGDFEGATGAVWVTGGSVFLTNDSTYIGFEGVGQFTSSNVTVSTSDLIVGVIGAGTLTVAGGTLNVSANGFGTLVVGEFTGSTGSVWVTGGGRLLVPNDTTVIGSGGTGELTVSNSTLAATDLIVGNFGAGTLSVAGGTVTVAAGFFEVLDLGGFFESTGMVRVTGGQLLVNAVTTTIGVSGSGQMLINAGTVSSKEVSVGTFFGSTGTLSIAGGTNTLSSFLTLGGRAGAAGNVWISGGQLSVLSATSLIGSNGIGQFTVSNGVARLRDVVLGFSGGSAGSLTVAGGTMTVFTGLTLGDCPNGGLGSLTMTGGRLFVTNAAQTAVLNVRNGTAMLSGGTLTVNRLVVTNSCGYFIHTGGTLGTNVVILSTNLDADGDGMATGWEQQYKLNPLNPTDANSDTDGDGLTALEEFLAGTIPTNSASSFRITAIAREGNNFRITWTTGAGKTNALQRAISITGGYISLFTVTNATGATTNYLDVGVASSASPIIYRVRLVP